MKGPEEEKLNELELQISMLESKLEELVFFEELLAGKRLKPKDVKEKAITLSKEGALRKPVLEHLLSLVESKNLNKEKKIVKESIKEFIKVFNSYSRLAQERGEGIGFIVLGKEEGMRAKILSALKSKGETPKPVQGGSSLKEKFLSLFVVSKKRKAEIAEESETEKKSPSKASSAFSNALGSVQKAIDSVKRTFSGASTGTSIRMQEAFKVPVFATGSGLAEKATKENFEKIEPAHEKHAGTIIALKETLFAEGKKSDIANKEKGLITLIPGYAYGKIVKQERGKKLYYVIEPDLSNEEREKITKIKNELIEVITIEELSREKMFEKVENIIARRGYTFSKQGRHKLMYYLSRDLLGLERIEPLMHDPLIEDIECDGVDVPVYVVHQKEGHLPTNIMFKSLENLEDYIIKLAQLSKTYVSYASPLVDSVLPDGSRVNAVLTKSVSTKGPSFTIRLFPEKPLPPTVLIKNETISARMMAYLWTVIEYKKSILITGPTASGKTTLLNAIAMCLPYGDRVVSIEDTRELNIKHENWLPQVARQGFGPPDSSGKRFGEVNMMTLIRESFRQRPDYLIVGEVRGKETFVLFQGMASGHCSIATLHARSVEDVVARLTTPPINLYPGLLESVDVIINLGFAGEQEIKRRLRAVAEVKRYNTKEQRLEYNDLLETNLEEIKGKDGRAESIAEFFPITGRSYLLKEISKEYDIPPLELQKKIERRTAFLKGLVKEGVFGYEEFAKRLEAYKNAERKAR